MKLVVGPDFPNAPPKGACAVALQCSSARAAVAVLPVLPEQARLPRACIAVLRGAWSWRKAKTEETPRPPAGYFLTKIFHPNVSNSGEICVNVLKRDWRPDLGLRHVLTVIRCLLIEPNPESALNEEAGKLLLEAYDDFARHARLMTSIHAKKCDQGLGVEGLSMKGLGCTACCFDGSFWVRLPGRVTAASGLESVLAADSWWGWRCLVARVGALMITAKQCLGTCCCMVLGWRQPSRLASVPSWIVL